MKNKKIKYISLSLILVIFVYTICLICFGNKDLTIVNKPYSYLLTSQPKLEDDYYEHMNYKYLSKDQIKEDEQQWLYMDYYEEIEREKEVIIDIIINNCSNHTPGSINDKICKFYNSYINNYDEAKMKQELDNYISMINNVNTIPEYIATALAINKELNIDIIIYPTINYVPSSTNQLYFNLHSINYDYDIKTSEYYASDEHEQDINKLKKYDVKVLKEYGYTDNEANKMVNSIHNMYNEIARFAIKSDKLEEKGYKLYTNEQLQNELINLNVTDIVNTYSNYDISPGNILVTDINQLKAIDEYLKEENLDTLKKYATMNILTNYSKYISEEFAQIDNDFQKSFYGYPSDYDSKKEYIYHVIYTNFMDTITSEFANRNFSVQEKDFYTNLILEAKEALKERIMNEPWLTATTKNIAADKIDKIEYTVGVPTQYVYAENNYDISETNSYLRNVINMNSSLNNTYVEQYKIGNIMYGTDYLENNAYYLPNNNSVTLLLGYMYTAKNALDIDVSNLNSSYYKLLGTIGFTIGHELTHALDSSGSKYDAEGNYVNWWTEEDLNNFNKLNSKVVKYYNTYEQFGYPTLGENIADLGAMAIILDMASKKNTTDEDYKTIFEYYTLDWCLQMTPYVKAWYIYNDEHSPAKNRVNAVLSSTDKFYEIYDIKSTDKMYVAKEDRVSVW